MNKPTDIDAFIIHQYMDKKPKLNDVVKFTRSDDGLDMWNLAGILSWAIVNSLGGEK